MIVHLDADVLVYRAGFAAEHNIYTFKVGNEEREFESKKALEAFIKEHQPVQYVLGLRREVEPLENALFNARSMIRTTRDKLEADEIILYLSGPTNFRETIAKTKVYKGNRDKAHKPVHGPEIKAMLRREFNVVTSDGQEADDEMAIAHYALYVQHPYDTCIATIDKDLDMIPGLHYNFAKDETYDIDPEQGIWNFYRQLLTGDATDNIPGIDGIGPVKAGKILPAVGASEQQLYQATLAKYVEAFGSAARDRMVEAGRLLWIRRQRDQWWNPPDMGGE